MGTLINIPQPQFLTEVRTYVFDFTGDLLAGVTVVSAVLTHGSPSGTASAAGTAVTSPSVNGTLGPLNEVGMHCLDCLATLSNGDKSAIRLMVRVKDS